MYDVKGILFLALNTLFTYPYNLIWIVWTIFRPSRVLRIHIAEVNNTLSAAKEQQTAALLQTDNRWLRTQGSFSSPDLYNGQ